jgi:tetratricopeptide (TPR) repeat protein
VRRALFAVALMAATAHAQPPDKATRAKAAAMYEQGSAHYEAGRFSEAIPLFRDAYELVHDPVYLFNLAQSYRKVLDCERASEYYLRYLEEARDADAKQRERVQGWLRELAPCVEERKTAVETARKAQEQAHEADRARRQAEAQQGPTYRTIDNGVPFRIGGYVAMGLGAVGIGLGIRYGIKGSDLKDELATACETGCNWSDEALRDKDEGGKRANTLSATFWITGGVALAGGVALYFVGRSRVERVQIIPLDGGAAFSTRVSF